VTELFRRFRYLLQRRRLDRELADDLEVHRELAARAGGGRPLGNTLRLREDAREVWGWMWIDRLSQDVRYGARLLRRSPAFTIAAVLMLALGIGVNVVAFGFFNLMVLRPLPVRDPESLLRFLRRAPGQFADNMPYPAVAFYREHTKTLTAVFAIHFDRLALDADGQGQPVNAHFVSANYFSELGGLSSEGRVFDPIRDDAPDAEAVVVLDHGFWQRRFSADPLIVGKTIRLNGQPAVVIGVATRSFSGLSLGNPDVWLPIVQQPRFVHGSRLTTDFSESGSSVFMWGRLRSGLTPAVAEAELRTLATALHRLHPADIWENEELPSEPGGYATRIVPPMYPVLALAGVLCLLILFAACSSLGSLLLARGVARRHEIATRVAIGAGHGRLLRQLLTESLLLALIGTVVAFVVGNVALRGLMAWAEAPPWLSPLPDWRLTSFAIGMGFVAVLLFGLTPAVQVARQRARVSVMRQCLIGAQVAASCVLLIVAALLVRALDRATSTRPGFEYDHVISIDPVLASFSPTAARAHLDALTHRLQALPGVASVSMATNPPLGNRWSVARAEIGGRVVAIHINAIDPAFFQTMTIPLLQGRNLLRGEQGTIIISDSLARLQWPAGDALGKTFRVGNNAAGKGPGDIVVGIAGSARLVSPEDSDAVEVYRLAGAEALPAMVMLVKTTVPPEQLVARVAAMAKAANPRLFPVVQLMSDAFRGRLETTEDIALSVSLLGCVALWLACAGIVGLVTYAVSQRTKEIGIRIALGARPGQVVAIILREFATPVLTGLLAGVGVAMLLSQVLRQTLYGLSNLDPFAYLAAIALFALTVAVAAFVPTTRALKVDPLNALRHE
jgi:predicted permease